MGGEVITLQIGQCGNQLGSAYWTHLLNEHGIDPRTGQFQHSENDPDKPSDRKELFFYQADDNRYVPRAVLIDLEPRVLNTICGNTVFNPESVWQPSGGGGAGNNWANGYDQGTSAREELLECLDREADACDSLEAFQLFHSLAGGTGSGVGSLLLENIRDRYGKALIKVTSVFPLMTADASDVVVQPYNTLLTLKRLAKEADCCICIDNTALTRIASDRLKLESAYISDMNHLVAQAMAAETTGMRFPSSLNADITSMMAALVPVPACHFLVTAFSPVTSTGQSVNPIVRKTTVTDVMRNLLSDANVMSSTSLRADGGGVFLSCLNIIRAAEPGSFRPADIQRALVNVHQRRLVSFAPWAPATVDVLVSRQSPYAPNRHRVSGLMLGNHSGIKALFERVITQYDKLMRRHAFLESYRQSSVLGDSLDEFYESQEILQTVIDEYTAAESIDFVKPWSTVDSEVDDPRIDDKRIDK